MRLRGFVTASVLLHLGALAALHQPALESGTASPSPRLSLVIRRSQVSPEAPARTSPASGSEQPITAARQVTAPDPVPAREIERPRKSFRSMAAAPPVPAAATVARIPAARQITSAIQARPTEPASGNTQSTAAVPEAAAKTEEATSELRRLFYANFTYPLLARRRGWEGEVRLGLRLEPDGRLTHIRIVQSSGFAILDKSALNTARTLELAPAAVRWLQGDRFDMILPVRYQLHDG